MGFSWWQTGDESLFITLSAPGLWLGFPAPRWSRAKCCEIRLPTSVEVFRKGDLAEERRHGMKWENWNGCTESDLCYYFYMTLVPLYRCTCTDGGGGDHRGNNQPHRKAFSCAHRERLIISITVHAWRESSFLLFREDLEYDFNRPLPSRASKAQTRFQMVFFLLFG